MGLGRIPELARRARIEATDPSLRDFALRVTRGARSEREAAAKLLREVQERVEFVRDPNERERGDTFRTARETLALGYGDCDDSAPLLAALGRSLGLRASLVAMSPEGPEPTHVSTKLAGLWAEPTLRYARLGEHPWAAAERLGVLRVDIGGAGLGAMAPAQHRWARDMLAQAFKKVRGRAPSLFEIQCIQAWSRHDASYGKGWGPACASSHNWGAIHAQPGQLSCPWQDTHPDGTVYVQPMRVWPTDEAGAEAYVRQMSRPARPLVEDALKRGRSVREWLDAMRRENYFGGFCPQAAAKFGKSVNGKPGTSEAADACHREAIDDPKQGALEVIRKVLVEITSALGEPMPPLLDDGRGSGGVSIGLPLVVLAAGGAYYAHRKGLF